MVVILVPCTVTLLIIVVLTIMVVTGTKKKNKKKSMEEEEMEEINGPTSADVTTNFKNIGPRKFSYEELASATNDFREEAKLGQGGFGGVYLGILRDTNEMVAVKRPFGSFTESRKGYVAEVTVLGRLSHRNLVKLIGCCDERGQFLLVYEYMSGGSLDSHIFSKKGQPVLPWADRRKVVLDLASAIQCLHEDWEQCVIHRDIKWNNVMVDDEFNAHLGDFGLARLSNHGFSPRTTTAIGTRGYAAPEYVTTGKASTRTDMYSFGVVLLEISTGQRAICSATEIEARLVLWVRDLYRYNSLMLAVDDRLGSVFDQQEMERMMIVGLWCVDPDADDRPTIREAIRVLNFQADMPKIPLKKPVLV